MSTCLEASDDGGVLLGPWTRVSLPLPPVVEAAAGCPQFPSSLFSLRSLASSSLSCTVTSQWNVYAPKSDSRRVVPNTKKAVPKAINPSAMSIHMEIDD